MTVLPLYKVTIVTGGAVLFFVSLSGALSVLNTSLSGAYDVLGVVIENADGSALSDSDKKYIENYQFPIVSGPAQPVRMQI